MGFHSKGIKIIVTCIVNQNIAIWNCKSEYFTQTWNELDIREFFIQLQ